MCLAKLHLRLTGFAHGKAFPDEGHKNPIAAAKLDPRRTERIAQHLERGPFNCQDTVIGDKWSEIPRPPLNSGDEETHPRCDHPFRRSIGLLIFHANPQLLT